MTRTEAILAVLQLGPRRLPTVAKVGLWLLAILGLGALLAAWFSDRAAWSVEAWLTACLVILGLSQVGIVWSAVIELTNSRWGRSVRRLMELSLAGAPVALLSLAVLLIGAPYWLPFDPAHLTGAKAIWLAHPFWALRNFLAVSGLYGLSLYYLYHCLRPDLGLAREQGHAYPGKLASSLLRHWRGLDEEVARSKRRRQVLAPLLCIGFALVYSLVGFDLVMALDPHWYSTLFGAYHFVGILVMGLALAILLAYALGHRIGPRAFFSAKHFGILGSLLFAFCFLLGDFFWSQFLTIYYADLPEETGYLLLRTMDPAYPWRHLAWAILGGFFGLPFITLLFRAVKWVPARLAAVALVVFSAMIAERFLTTAPPLLGLRPGAPAAEMWQPLALTFLVSLAFLAMGGLLYGWLARQVPLMPISDPLFIDSLKDNQERPK